MDFKGKKVLITGGAGFLGSNLAIKLTGLGADVSIVDNMLAGHGGNLFNIEPVKDKIRLDIADIRNKEIMEDAVRDKDYIFHLAGQVNHVESIRNPLEDLDINCRGTLVLLEACRKNNMDAKIVFTGTRGQYGPSTKLPVSEDHPTNPKGIYAITNLAAEKMILVYDDVHKIKGVCLRITNTYGPRHQMMHDEFGVFNWFIRKAMNNEAIEVFGDGRIIRDYVYVDDTIEAILALSQEPKAFGDIFNIGGGTPINFIDLAQKIVKIAAQGSVKFRDFTVERKSLEPGDYVADISKIKNLIGWQPKTGLDSGIRQTMQYYSKFKKHYWQ